MTTILEKTTSYTPKNSLNKVGRSPTPLETTLNLISQKDLSNNSKRALQSDLTDFFVWFENINGEAFSFERTVRADVLDYKRALLIRHKPSTINRKLASLRCLFKTALKAGVVAKELTENIKPVAATPLAPKSLTQLELRHLLRETELRGNKRDVFILSVMAYAGLRCSEVVNLHYVDIKMSPRLGFFQIRHSKNNKSRQVPISSRLRAVLRNFIEANELSFMTELKTRTGPVFIGERGPLKTIAINKVVEKYANCAQVKASPHTLRHTFSYNYLKQNPADINGLAAILGHSSLNTTARYCIQRLEDLTEKMERF